MNVPQRLLAPNLMRVIALHVGRGGVPVERLRALGGVGRAGLGVAAEVELVLRRRCVNHSARAARLLDALAIFVGVVLGVVREAGFEEQRAGHRRRPLDRGGVIRRRVPHRAPRFPDRSWPACRGRGTCRSRRSRPRSCCAATPARSGAPSRS